MKFWIGLTGSVLALIVALFAVYIFVAAVYGALGFVAYKAFCFFAGCAA